MSWLAKWQNLQVSRNGKPLETHDNFIFNILKSIDEGNTSYSVTSSGTSKNPVQFFLDFEAGLKNAAAHAESLGIGPGHTIIQTLPVNHAFGILSYILTPLITGCGVDLCETLRGPREIETLPFTKQVCHLVPAHFPLWKKPLTTGWAPAILTCGADLWEEEKLFLLSELYPSSKLFVTYGLTQAGPRVSTRVWMGKTEKGNVGRPIKGVETLILEGELCVHTPSMALNLKEDEIVVVEGKKYLRTHDYFKRSPDGLIFSHRIDDMIKIGGKLLSPHALVDFCKTLPQVHDAAYISRDHPYLGLEILLFLEMREDDKKDSIKEAITKFMPQSDVGLRIYFSESFPRNTMGKIMHEKLRELV